MAIAVSPKQSACGPPYPLRDTDLSPVPFRIPSSYDIRTGCSSDLRILGSYDITMPHSSCVSLWERGRPARGLTKMRISYGEYGQWTSY